MAMLKDEYNRIRQEVDNATDWLKVADTYSHLYLRALDDVLAEGHLPRWIVQPSLESLMDHMVTNTRQYKEAYKWCRKPSHDTHRL
jgi:hypothetical protein